MKSTLEIQNLKCGGCENTLRQNLSKFSFINNLEIDVACSTLSYEAVKPEDTELIVLKLSELGYPVIDEVNSLSKKAMSYLSCVMGRVKK